MALIYLTAIGDPRRYLSEFQFQLDNRKAQDIFLRVVVALVVGSALRYTGLVARTEETADRR